MVIKESNRYIVFLNRVFGGYALITIKKPPKSLNGPTAQSGAVGFKVSQSGSKLSTIQKEGSCLLDPTLEGNTHV